MSARALTYARYELLRMFRNTRFFIFSLVFPVLMYLLIVSGHRHDDIDGVYLPLYFMVGMVAWGAMTGVIASGARIAAERAAGWSRQLRLTTLPTPVYLAVKILTGYAMALATIALLYTAGTASGVRLPVQGWLEMTGLILVGLVPFAVLGILLGHLLTVDSLGPALGGITAVFAVLGGTWGPIAGQGVLHHIAEWLPSYWLVQAAKTGVGTGSWPLQAWVVIAVWTVALARLAGTVYRRDTKRV
jgi:ABC-2 type transport system permease protein